MKAHGFCRAFILTLPLAEALEQLLSGQEMRAVCDGQEHPQGCMRTHGLQHTRLQPQDKDTRATVVEKSLVCRGQQLEQLGLL